MDLGHDGFLSKNQILKVVDWQDIGEIPIYSSFVDLGKTG